MNKIDETNINLIIQAIRVHELDLDYAKKEIARLQEQLHELRLKDNRNNCM